MTGEELIEQANEYVSNGDHAAAAETYLKAFELMPEEPLLPWEAGRLYLYFVPDPALAVRWFEVALPRLPDPIQARDTRYHIGLAHTFLKDDARAAARFAEVLADTPTHVLSCLELGKIHVRSGDHERAKDLLQQAILHNNMRSTLPEMFPDGQRGSPHAHALGWINLGRLGLAAGDEKLTRLAACKLLDDLDDDGRVMMLAKEAVAGGKPGAARAVLDALLAHAPEHAAALAMQEELG